VTPGDGHLAHREPRLSGARQHLDVEGEAGRSQWGEETPSRRRREALQPALGVEAVGEVEPPQEPVVGATDHDPVPWGGHGDRAFGMGTSRAHHFVRTLLDATEAGLDVGRIAGQIGVGKGHGGPPTGQHPGPHRGALALVHTQLEDRNRQPEIGGDRLGDGGGVVVTAVVDQQDLGAGVVEARVGQRRQGRPDPGRLAVHGDDERPGRGHGQAIVGE